MSLETGIIALAEAVGTDVKELNVKIGDLTQLTTTAKNNLVDAVNEDAALSHELANPDKGAAMVARGVVAVESVSDLRAMQEGQRKEGLRYLVKGYHDGSDVGGGEFYWVASKPRASHDGGYIIDPEHSGELGSEGWYSPVGGGEGCFVRVLGEDQSTTPEMFGAVGDGVALDAKPILNAITAAGEGGVISLSTDKVYLVDRPFYLLGYQKLVGNNSVLRRVNQVVTTITTAMSTTTTSVTLTDVSGFKVGQSVAFASVGVARGKLVINSSLSTQRIITGISGNTITLNAGPSVSFSVGSTCFLAFNTVTLGESCSVSGVRFDGNRANWSFNRWEVICELDTINTSFGQLVTNNIFVDSPSDAIMARSGDAIYSHNKFKDINGNAFHTSNVRNNLIVGNHGVNGNLDMDVGHQDGFVSISLQNFNITIKDNIASQFVSGVSPISIGNNQNANFIITDNQFKDMYCWGIGRISAPNVTITGNILDNIPTDPTKKPGAAAAEYAPISIYGAGQQVGIVSNNIVTNTLGVYSMYLLGSPYDPTKQGGLKVFGNMLDGDVMIGGQDVQFQQNSSGGLLRILNSRRVIVKNNTVFGNVFLSGNGEYVDVAIDGNTIIGGANGVHTAGSASLYENLTIRNNILSEQTNRGIQTPEAGPVIKGFWVTGNIVEAGADAPSNYIGIAATRDGVVVSDNRVSTLTPLSSGTGIYAGAASTNYEKLTITRNEVRGDWQSTISLISSSTGIVVANNVLEGKDVTGPVANADTYNIVY